MEVYKCSKCSNDSFYLSICIDEEEREENGILVKYPKPWEYFKVICSECDHTLKFKKGKRNV